MIDTNPSINLLSVSDLSVSYAGITAVKKVTLEVRKGEIVSLIGANGAGKTSTLSAISNVIKKTTGKIYFNSEDISNLAAHQIVAKGLIQVPEGRKIFGKMTIKENLFLGAYLETNLERRNENLEKNFKLFPILKERLNQLAGTLSGGEQQMLALARALMASPKLILLDEPSMGVAPMLVEKIFDTLIALNKEDLSILLVEQNANKALSISSRAYVLEMGEILLSGESAKIKEDPKIQEAYLGN